MFGRKKTGLPELTAVTLRRPLVAVLGHQVLRLIICRTPLSGVVTFVLFVGSQLFSSPVASALRFAICGVRGSRVQIDYNVVHIRTSLVRLFVLLQLNFEEVVQIIELRRFGGAPNGYPFAALRGRVSTGRRRRGSQQRPLC
jgi:hypothetical protein